MARQKNEGFSPSHWWKIVDLSRARFKMGKKKHCWHFSFFYIPKNKSRMSKNEPSWFCLSGFVAVGPKENWLEVMSLWMGSPYEKLKLNLRALIQIVYILGLCSDFRKKSDANPTETDGSMPSRWPQDRQTGGGGGAAEGIPSWVSTAQRRSGMPEGLSRTPGGRGWIPEERRGNGSAVCVRSVQWPWNPSIVCAKGDPSRSTVNAFRGWDRKIADVCRDCIFVAVGFSPLFSVHFDCYLSLRVSKTARGNNVLDAKQNTTPQKQMNQNQSRLRYFGDQKSVSPFFFRWWKNTQFFKGWKNPLLNYRCGTRLLRLFIGLVY